MPVITLTTDFGLKDGNAGVMKGVIWNIAPQVQFADLSNQISPQNIAEAALVLGRAAPFFPSGSIHLVVVDPGVGTQRRPIAALVGEQYVVAPDNGVITPLLERAESEIKTIQIVHLNKPQYWLPVVSHVFHGRDIFAPVAGHLAAGVSLEELGTPIHDPVRLELPQPKATPNGWRGEIIHIDHFGNIASNIMRSHLGESPAATIRICGVNIGGMVKTFGERQAGELIALYGSSGNLIVSVVNGNAAQRVDAHPGDPVEVTYSDR